MERYEAAEALRQFLLSHGLPHTDITLIGLRCPYCGKSDRIQQLEHPREIPRSLSDEAKHSYSTLFEQLIDRNEALGVCRFCQNPLRLAGGLRPEPLEAGF